MFVGTEASQSPAVPALVETARALAERGIAAGAVSARHGLRATVNAAGVPLGALSARDFVEVADYDPHAETFLCLGPAAPSEHAALHALVYRAKAEVGAIVQVEAGEGSPARAGIPQVALGRSVLESAMEVLKALRSAGAISLGGRHVLAVGRTPEEARAIALAALPE